MLAGLLLAGNLLAGFGGAATPAVQSGGGGGSSRVHREQKKRRLIAEALDEAIDRALRPRPVAAVEGVKAATVWTAPQRQTVFPDVWRELQLVALADAELKDIERKVRALVAAQQRQHKLSLAVMAEDEDAAQALMAFIVRDFI